MKRLKSALAYTLPIALVLGLASVSMAVTTTPASAQSSASDDGWYPWMTWTDSDGTLNTSFFNAYDERFVLHIAVMKDGTTFTRINDLSKSDPGPDDTSKGSDPVDVVALIKAGLVTYKVRANPEDTPLGKWLTRGGNGAGPHINPGDDGDSKGPGSAPVKKTGGPTAAQIRSYIKAMNIAARAMQQLGASMGDVEGLSSEEKPSYSSHSGGKNSGKSNGKNNDNGPNPDGDGKNKYLGSGFDSLGPHPELVNPPHSTSRVTTKTGASGKGTSSTSSSAMNPGLLDGGSTFGSQGPSATGSPAGSSSRGSSGAAGIR